MRGSQPRRWRGTGLSVTRRGAGRSYLARSRSYHNSVDWGDLQYVVFTLVTLAYFAIQFLAQPANGLPPVPAALLTLMGVSATGYAANKVVSTKVNLKDAKADGQ